MILNCWFENGVELNAILLCFVRPMDFVQSIKK